MENNWNLYFFKFIEKYPNKPWNWRGLSRNQNITWDIVKANPNKPWCWYGFQFEGKITHYSFYFTNYFRFYLLSNMFPIFLYKIISIWLQNRQSINECQFKK